MILVAPGTSLPAHGFLVKVDTSSSSFEEEEKQIVVSEKRRQDEKVQVAKHSLDDCDLNNWLDPFIYK